MNRVLKIDDKFQVLCTPSFTSHASFEMQLNNWTDAKLRGYKVVEFETLQDAMDLAYKFPIVDWNRLVNFHEDAYEIITDAVKKSLHNGTFIVEIDSHLQNPTELKETIFKRVAHRGERFNLFYDANDIICINIINPWTRNLVEIANVLKNVPELRIKQIYNTPTHITMIGFTDVGTTYEIRLWTSVIAQWARWVHENKLNPYEYIGMLKQLKETQKRIDDNDMIR